MTTRHLLPGFPLPSFPLPILALAATAFITPTLTGAAAAAADAAAPAITIVDCVTHVRSHKRGICENQMDAADFKAIAPGVSWFYNWNFATSDVPAAELKIAFLPMVWGDRPADLAGLSAWLDAGNKPPAVLAINEPNLKGQAYIAPQTTAELYAKVAAIAAAHHLPVVGPNMALGSSPGDSITAHDPVENKDLTYTWFVPFLKAFASFAGPCANGAPVGVHSYKDINELRWCVETAHKLSGGQVWVTEFAQWGANTANERAFLIQAVDYLERTPYVAGYAWFKERLDKSSSLSLLAPEAGKLTPLGETYLAMPAHDAPVYYRLPGKLQAEDFATTDKSEVKAVDDGDGFLEVDLQSGGYIDLHVQVDNPGIYTLGIRAAGQGNLALQTEGAAALTTVAVPADAWQTVAATVTLKAGAQTVRISADGKRERLDWIEWQKH